MRKFILLLFFAIFVSSSHADEAACNVHNINFTNAEKFACGVETAKAAGAIQPLLSTIEEKEIDIALTVVDKNLGTSFTGNVDAIQTPFGEFSKGSLNIVQQGFYFVFVMITAGGVFVVLNSAMINGAAFNKGTVIYLFIGFLCAWAAGSGVFFNALNVFKVISFLFTMWLFTDTVLAEFKQMADDIRSEQTQFSQQAEEFGKESAKWLIRVHMQDLVARKGLLVETGKVNKTGISTRFTVDDEAFQTCLATTMPAEGGAKFFIPPSVEITQKCSSSELDYKVYKIGYVSDDKTTDQSVKLIATLREQDSAARSVAYQMINSVCGGIYEVDKDLVASYASTCLDMTVDGLVIKDGEYAVTVDATKMADFDTNQAAIKELEDRIAASAYLEMLANANTVNKSVIENINPNEMFAGFNVGDVYKKAYKAAGDSVLEIKFVEDVVIRKSALKQFFGVEENLSLFGGSGTNNNFGLAEFANQFYTEKTITQDIIGILDQITGNGGTRIGLEWRDCFERGGCNSGNSNPITIINGVTSSVLKVLGLTYLGSEVMAKHYKKRAELAKDRQDKIYLNSLAHAWSSQAMTILMIILAFVFVVFMIVKIFVIDVFIKLVEGVILLYTSPISLGSALVMSLISKFFRDDGMSLTDYLKRFGFWDAMLRLPLIILSFYCFLQLLKIVMPINVFLMTALFASNAAMGVLGDIGAAVFYVFMSTVFFMVSFLIVSKVFLECMGMIEEICYGGNSYTHNVVDKFKKNVDKALNNAFR